MRLHPVYVCVFLIGCREPDFGPVRADLTASADLVCAPSPPRPPPTAKTKTVTAADVEAAVVTLCNGPDDAAFATLHEGLAQDTALVGQVRRNRMLVDGPKPGESPAPPTCRGSWPGLGAAMLASAETLAKAGRFPEAFARCTDVVAMARDVDLTGDLLDTLMANNDIQQTVAHCRPLIDLAPKEAATPFGDAIATLKASFPPSLEDAFRRDRAELVVYNFGRLRDPAKPLPCDRATALASVQGGMPSVRADRFELVRRWGDAKSVAPPDAKYAEAYTLSLETLDTLVRRAKER